MMNFSIKALVLATAAMSVVPAAFADDVTSSGTVTITGEVKQNACVVDDDSKNLTVTLEDVFANIFTAAGNTAAEKDFTINLKDCNNVQFKNAQLRFEGPVDSRVSNNTVLENTDGDSLNIGVQILDASASGGNSPMVFTHTDDAWSGATKLPDGEATTVKLPFKARYYAIAPDDGNGNLTGTVGATATFYLRYN
ncbi:fimbrial protein [Superficieibacter sp. BNK-5]|uniref:fimbrial protein n=1 Tax=Superficieibacter sp. BNK-5 TaxID=3376142 RepID=UPI0039BF2AE7